MIWFITILFVVLGFTKVYVYHYKHTPKAQETNVKSGKEFDKQFNELEKYMDEREKAKKQKKPMEKQRPEANNSIKPKNMLLKRFDESYNFDGA